MSDLSELLADCDVRGIWLHPAGDGGLTIDAPQAALTPEIVARLKAHKAELLALLRPPRSNRKPRRRRSRRPNQYAVAVRQPGETYQFTMGNQYGGTAPAAGGSSIFLFGMERVLDTLTSIR